MNTSLKLAKGETYAYTYELSEESRYRESAVQHRLELYGHRRYETAA